MKINTINSFLFGKRNSVCLPFREILFVCLLKPCIKYVKIGMVLTELKLFLKFCFRCQKNNQSNSPKCEYLLNILRFLVNDKHHSQRNFFTKMVDCLVKMCTHLITQYLIRCHIMIYNLMPCKSLKHLILFEAYNVQYYNVLCMLYNV